MAYLTQYSNSVPVIKYHVDQTFMTIGQNIDMDICVPEDGVAESHAALEAIKTAGTYRFLIKSAAIESLLKLNGVSVSRTEIQDGDWLFFGDVEFQFTDDGVNLIKEKSSSTAMHSPSTEEISKPTQKMSAKTKEKDSDALKLIKGLKEDLQDNSKPLTTKEFIANSRQSRRRLAF